MPGVARLLYSLLFSWLVEHINQKLCRDDFASLIGLLDFPGFQNLSGTSSRPNSLDQLCVNYANERLQAFIYDLAKSSRHSFWLICSTSQEKSSEYNVCASSSLLADAASASKKIVHIHKELCTIFLDAEAASANRDELAQTLYSLLFSWLVEQTSVQARPCWQMPLPRPKRSCKAPCE
jgi:myosin heavy subunit